MPSQDEDVQSVESIDSGAPTQLSEAIATLKDQVTEETVEPKATTKPDNADDNVVVDQASDETLDAVDEVKLDAETEPEDDNSVDELLRAEAEGFGITDPDALGRKQLTQVLNGVAKKMAEAGTPPQKPEPPQGQSPPVEPNPEAQQTTQQSANVLPEFEFKTTKDDYPEVHDDLTRMHESINSTLTQIVDAVTQAFQKVNVTQHADETSKIDAQLDAFFAEQDPSVFGEGSSATMERDNEAYKNREKVWNSTLSMNAFLGKVSPSNTRVRASQGLRAVFPNAGETKTKTDTAKDIARKADERSGRGDRKVATEHKPSPTNGTLANLSAVRKRILAEITS